MFRRNTSSDVIIGGDKGVPQRQVCSDCKGSGEYRGLFVVEPCQRCNSEGNFGKAVKNKVKQHII